MVDICVTSHKESVECGVWGGWARHWHDHLIKSDITLCVAARLEYIYLCSYGLSVTRQWTEESSNNNNTTTPRSVLPHLISFCIGLKEMMTRSSPLSSLLSPLSSLPVIDAPGVTCLQSVSSRCHGSSVCSRLLLWLLTLGSMTWHYTYSQC